MLPLGGWRLQCLMAFRRSGCRDQIPGSLLFLTLLRPYADTASRRIGSEGAPTFRAKLG